MALGDRDGTVSRVAAIKIQVLMSVSWFCVQIYVCFKNDSDVQKEDAFGEVHRG